MKKFLVLPLLLLAFPIGAAPKKPSKTSSKATTPQAGSAERKAIMDAMRVPVQKETKFPVIFKVGSLKMQDGWAFFSGQALHKDGKPINRRFFMGRNGRAAAKTKHKARQKMESACTGVLQRTSAE